MIGRESVVAPRGLSPLSPKPFCRSSSVPTDRQPNSGPTPIQDIPKEPTPDNGSPAECLPPPSSSVPSPLTSAPLVKSASTSALFKSTFSPSSSTAGDPDQAVMKPRISDTDCESIRLPENLESIPKAELFPTQRHRWNTNEEIAALLISFDKHSDWLSKEVKIRPKSGSMLLYSRKKVRYRRDGYCWKKRKDGKTTREDHMKLKVQGIECIYGCYVHSAILPTFHRRCYWLLQNPDIVLVHYLNVPYPDDNKLVMASSISLWADKKEWTKEELISQLRPMFFSEDEPDINSELEISTAETVEAIVGQLMEKQRAARAASSKGLVECGSVVGVGSDHSKLCNHHPLRRLSIAKLPQAQQQPHQNHHLQNTPHHHHHPTQPPPQQQQQQHHRAHAQAHPQHHPHHHDSSGSVISSRQSLVTLPTSSEADVNQVSSTSGGGLRYQDINQEGTRHAPPPYTPTPSSPSPPNNKNNNSSSSSNNSNINNNKNNKNNNSNVNSKCSNSVDNESSATNNIMNDNSSTCTKTTPLILNLSNIQGGGGLLILNSGAAHHPSAAPYNAPQFSAPFTLTSYFAQPHSITSTGTQHSTIHHRMHPAQIFHTGQQQLAHMSSHNQHELQIQQAQHHPLRVSNTPVVIKREAKDNVMESLKLDVTNGNLTLDSGTFANLVSSLEASDQHSKGSHKDILLSIKSEQLTDLGKEELFSTSLDLCHDEVQKTLSANLPSTSCDNKSPRSADDNPMDFIESNMVAAEDDVLANLDAFDMFNDFPDLDHYDTSPPDNLNSNNSNSSASSATNISGKSVTNQSQQTLRADYRENSANITDYSPEWAYPEGGVKVLVTGPWYSTTSPYTVLFDGVPSSTTLVQAGVLRCYCPAHEVGLVTLQVACEGFIVSNSVIFEYKKHPQDTAKVKEEDNLQEQDENLLKFTLLQRMETLESCVQPPSHLHGPEAQSSYDKDIMIHRSPLFEDHAVTYCQKLGKRPWLPSAGNHSEEFAAQTFLKGQTLLHLSARLGYARFIICLLRWRDENASVALDWEVDALRKDKNGRTALSWACISGHRDAALVLYKWNPQAIRSQDNQAKTPLTHAHDRGYYSLEVELRKLEEENESMRSSISCVTNPKNSSSSFLSSALRKSSSSSHVLPSFAVEPSSSSCNFAWSSVDAASPSNLSDGFLRPSPRRCDLRKLRHLSVDLLLGGESEALRIGNSGGNSPSLSWSEGGRKSRIVKRSSVDSGINLSSVDSYKRASLDSGLDILQKHSRNDLCASRGSRNSEFLSSPMQADFGTSGDTSFSHRSSVSSEMATSDDSRVFTLAEQIIAAIPERIKGDEEDVTELLSPCPTEPPSSDLSMEVILDDAPDSSSEFNFELSDVMSYRYMDVSTPSSSLSPASSSCLPSPASFVVDSPSPPPTTADFSEFFHASTRDFSKDFSNLTLSDQEQRELYEAAKIIQKAYRLYQGRKRQQAEQDKERQAAILIQNYYRRYKQYAYYRQMSRAATLIQTQFRSYCESKRFKKCQKESKFSVRSSREGTPVQNLKRSFSQRKQHQAARKIQQFMRQTKQKLQRERALAAEREKSLQSGGPTFMQGSGPPPFQDPLAPLSGAGAAQSPVQGTCSLLQSLHPRVLGARLSEPSRRVTDPLLSTTAHHHHRPEKRESDLGDI